MTADRKLWQHQIEREAYRRITAGEAPETLGEFTEQLLSWFLETHPGHPVTSKVVEDQIRDTGSRVAAHVSFVKADVVVVIDTVDTRAAISMWNREDIERHRLLRLD